MRASCTGIIYTSRGPVDGITHAFVYVRAAACDSDPVIAWCLLLVAPQLVNGSALARNSELRTLVIPLTLSSKCNHAFLCPILFLRYEKFNTQGRRRHQLLCRAASDLHRPVRLRCHVPPLRHLLAAVRAACASSLPQDSSRGIYWALVLSALVRSSRYTAFDVVGRP